MIKIRAIVYKPRVDPPKMAVMLVNIYFKETGVALCGGYHKIYQKSDGKR